MISVCIASHNGGVFIKTQVDSILNQLSEKDEIIISDDGSTDNTLQELSCIHDDRIKLYNFQQPDPFLPPVYKATLNFENALKHAQGDYIFLSDQDDIWHSSKVEVSIHYLLDLDYDYICSDCFIINENENVISDSIYPKNYKFNKYKSLFGFTPFQGSCAAFKRNVLLKALPFPYGIQSHDRWIGWIAAFNFKIKTPIPDKLIFYRIHSNNVSTVGGKSTLPLKKRILIRLQYCKELFNRCILNK